MSFDEERDLQHSRRAHLENWRLRCTYDGCSQLFQSGDNLESVLAHTRGAHQEEAPRFELVWVGPGEQPPPTKLNGY